MNKNYLAVPTLTLANSCTLSHPPALPDIAHLSDPAINFMTDFKANRAFTISPAAPLSEAAIEMKACNVHMLLVVDKSQTIIGMITSEDLLGEKPLKVAMTRQIKRSEVLVRMIMLAQEKIIAINIEELKHAKVGNIVTTLNELKQHYALIVENHSALEQRVRGMFSLWDISKRAGENLTFNMSEAHSLAELQRNLEHK